jgi:short-subunit dehydrogenase
MKLQGKRILLTGAAGGIGAELARQLGARGACLALADRNAAALAELAASIEDAGGEAHIAPVDLLEAGGRETAVQLARERLGGIDLLVNNAGLQSFRAFAEEDPAMLARVVQLNLLAPMLLTRAVLPEMLLAGSGRIVNLGSTFGSIGFAYFVVYSASKFGLRGFSEALRRELEGSGVGVTFVAPRAARTPLNTGSVYRMAEATGMRMDEPRWVAEQVVEAIEHDRRDVYLGWPESLFVRVNAALPRLVDRALRRQRSIMARFAAQDD